MDVDRRDPPHKGTSYRINGHEDILPSITAERGKALK